MSWWGPMAIAPGDARTCEVGPLRLRATRRPEEWALAWRRLPEHGPAPVEPADPWAGAETARFAFSETAGPLELMPALPDREVVASPEAPFWLPPGERVRAYVGVAVWVQICVGPGRRLLTELPASRPPDTWFGSPTEGTLCYGSRTALRLDLAGLPTLPHRAIVPVELRNSGKEPLEVARLRLPAPSLPVLVDGQGRLWTPPVVLERHEDENATAQEGAPPPDQRPLAPARAARSGSLFHAFNAFFGRGRA